jgi:diguanylate cyclase (GGDEF)-like protein
MSEKDDLALLETDDVARLRSLGETEETLFEAASETEPASRRGREGEVTSLRAPLVFRGGAIDLLVLRQSTGGGLSETDALTFSTLRDLAMAAIAGRQAQDEARLDTLTGCLNHGAMHAQLAKEVAQVERSGGPLSCVMLDLDGFKSVNERYGHPVGDALLRAVATNLLAEGRLSDSCCRSGGDEFLVILPNSDMTEGKRAAERMRAAVARAAVSHGDEVIAVTATTGVAAWDGGESASDLLTRADQALIRRKAAERNNHRDGSSA